MTEDELRALVRDVIAARVTPPPLPSAGPPASHARLGMVVPTVAGSPCLIEPQVGCNQCGYCVSMGH